jgi:hypothetical protein
MKPFGVRDPETGRVILALVNGSSGADFGLSLYPDTAGFFTMDRILHGLLGAVNEESLHEIRSIVCSFVSRSGLKAWDRQLLRDTGHDARRGELVPLFRSYVPGHFPWHLDAGEALMLTVLLRQSVNVARDFAAHPGLFKGGPKYCYPTRRVVPDELGAPDAYEWATPDILVGPPPPAPRPDELTAARLARLPIDDDVEWEVALATGAGVLQESPLERPELMLTLLVLDRASDYILHGEPMRATTALVALQKAFAGVLLRLGFAPRRVLVRNFAERIQLAPVTKLTGSKLYMARRLPGIERASVHLREFMTGGG